MNSAGDRGVAREISPAAGFTIGSGPTQCSSPEISPRPTIDWEEAKRLAAQSEAMCKLILAAVNNAITPPVQTNRRGKQVAAQVIPLVAVWFGYEGKDLSSKPRNAALVWARQVAAYFCNELTEATTVEIGDLLRRHHGCVGHSLEVVRNRMETEPRTKSDIEALRKHLEAKLP